MNMTVLQLILGLVCIAVIQVIIVDCYECCQHQQLFLKIENEAASSPKQLLIGDDFTLTCLANKTVTNKNCQQYPIIDCNNECEPKYGVAMWFCRDSVNRSQCLVSQLHSGPQPCLQFNSTTEDMPVTDSAINITASFSVKNGGQSDSDRYYCVAGTMDDCFYGDKDIPNQYLDVEFKEGKAPNKVNITSSENNTNKYIHIKEGASLNLTCDPDGYPTPNISWFHNGETKTWKGRVKAFLGITNKDGGKYKCMATNLQGSRNSTELHVIIDKPWKLWLICAVAGGSCLALLILICLIWLCCHHHCRRCCSKPAPDSNHGSSSWNISNSGNWTTFNITNYHMCCYCQKDRNQPIDNNYSEGEDPSGRDRDSNQPTNSDHTDEDWLVYYHECDSEYAQKVKDDLETNFLVKQVTLWKNICHDNPARSVGFLSTALKTSNYIVLMRTENFVQEKEHYFVQAISKIPIEIQNDIKSKMFILSQVSCSLPECIQSGPTQPTSITISDDDESCWQHFRDEIASLNSSATTSNETSGHNIGVTFSDDQGTTPLLT